MLVLLGISCSLDCSKTLLNHRKLYKHLTLQILDVTFYFTLSAYEPYSIPSSKNCKLLILQNYAHLTRQIESNMTTWAEEVGERFLLRSFPSIALRIIFSLWLDLAEEVNRHFLENDYGDLSFFFCRFELSSKFFYVK